MASPCYSVRLLRPRVIKSVDLIGRALKLWLLGQLVLMVGVGILSFIAVWLIGLPNPGALALLAGVAEIIPYIGPFLSAIPAVLVALANLLFGIVGVVLAASITVVVYMTVKMAYVEDPLE